MSKPAVNPADASDAAHLRPSLAPAAQPSTADVVEVPVVAELTLNYADANAIVSPPDDATVISQRPPLADAAPARSSQASRELGATLVGRKLAHFYLSEFVGGGGMGAVFRAVDTMLNRTVAVKVLSRDQGRDEETVRRFQNEAQSAARLDHDNIARVYYVGEDDGWYFIVFEFIEGLNLREYVNDHGPLSVEQALQVILQVAEALDHSAQRDVVHRDIKPSNVLLMPSGKAKLVDMGLARLRPLNADNEDLTASGVTLGTFDYISPEQARDPRTADVRSDIYSLGCTLYFMLTGQPPFAEGTVLQKLLSHSSENPPDPRVMRPDLPAELVPVMNRMLAKKPGERYQRPVDLIADLLLLADRLGLVVGARPETAWYPPEPSRWQHWQFHLPWLVATIALLALATFFDPATLDGRSRSAINPRFEIPASGRLDDVPRDHDLPANSPTPNDEQRPDDVTGAGEIVATADGSPANPTDTDAPTTDSTRANTGAANGADAVRESGRERTPSTRVASASADRGVPADTDRNSSSVGNRRTADGSAPSEHLDASSPNSNGLDSDGLDSDGGDSDGGDVPLEERNRESTHGSADRGASDSQLAARTVIFDPSAERASDPNERIVNDLAEAIRLVRQNPRLDTIEIRHTGRIAMVPLRLRLENRSLTLIAGAGYAPILSFRTGMSVADLESAGMIQVSGGTLAVRGIHLELVIPNDTLDGEWSLFELSQFDALHVQRSAITIHNSYGGRFSNLDNVAVFNCPPAGRAELLDPDMGEPRPASKIHLQDCVIRCEATVLRARESLPLQFIWNNGLLITSERLASLGGRTSPARDSEHIQLDLQQVTAIVDQGLAELSSNAARPHLVPVAIRSSRCVFVTQRWSPLVLQSGPHSLADLMAQLAYRGDQCAYEGMESLWKINPQEGTQAESLDYEMWQTHWHEQQSSWQQVRWRSPLDKNRPIHEYLVGDYIILPQETGVAGQPRPAPLGCQPTSLPALPEPDRPWPKKTRPFYQS